MPALRPSTRICTASVGLLPCTTPNVAGTVSAPAPAGNSPANSMTPLTETSRPTESMSLGRLRSVWMETITSPLVSLFPLQAAAMMARGTSDRARGRSFTRASVT